MYEQSTTNVHASIHRSWPRAYMRHIAFLSDPKCVRNAQQEFLTRLRAASAHHATISFAAETTTFRHSSAQRCMHVFITLPYHPAVVHHVNKVMQHIKQTAIVLNLEFSNNIHVRVCWKASFKALHQLLH